MKANGTTLVSYEREGKTLDMTFDLPFDTVRNLETSSIEVTTDDGTPVEGFVGYVKRSVEYDVNTGMSTIHLMLSDDAMVNAVTMLGRQYEEVSKKADDAAKDASDAGAAVDALLGMSEE